MRRAELAADLVHFGKVEEAIAELKRCTEDYPGFAKAWGDLGYLHELRGESERAIECYQKYGELAPEDPASFEKIGDCFLAMRMRARAYQAYLRAAALHSDPPFSLLEKSARAESVLSKLRRRGAPLCARLCKRLLSPTFLAAFARELASLPRSIAAIRASGVAQFLGYLNRHYLEGDWRRHPALPCDLCGSRRFKPVFYYGMQKNVRCGNCGLEFVLKKPPESQDVFLNSYDGEKILQHFEKEWAIPQINEHRLQAVRGLFDQANLPFPGKGTKALEVGCGRGNFLVLLRELGLEVEGIETGRRLVEECVRDGGLLVHHDTVRSLERPDASYDLIFAFHVLEHLEKPSEFFEKALRLLRPGGFLVVEVPTPDLSKASHLQKMHPHHGYANIGHLHYFTPITMPKYFERFGFELIASYEYRTDALPSGGFLGRKPEQTRL